MRHLLSDSVPRPPLRPGLPPTVGEVEVADAHHFILDAPSDELRGKAAQLKALEPRLLLS